jgi:hypothetical protein
MTAQTHKRVDDRRQIEPGASRPVEPGAKDLQAWLEDTWSDVLGARRKAYMLMGDIEGHLDERRGKVALDGHTVTLSFQREGIDATQWLTGQVWSDIANIEERMRAKLDSEAGDTDLSLTECVAEVEAYHRAFANHSALFTAQDQGQPGVTDAQVMASLDPIDDAVLALCRFRPITREGTERRQALLSKILPGEIEGRLEWSKDVIDALLGASGVQS